MMLPMTLFTTAVNGIFAAIIIAAFAFTGQGVTDVFVLNLLFYMLITSVLTVTIMKVAYAGESQMIVNDALNRMSEILETEPLPDNGKNEKPADSSVSLENVAFSYENAENNAIDGVNISVKSGEHIALVGPSGGGKTTVSRLAARFWDIDGGKITIGGMDVSKVDPEKLPEFEKGDRFKWNIWNIPTKAAMKRVSRNAEFAF